MQKLLTSSVAVLNRYYLKVRGPGSTHEHECACACSRAVRMIVGRAGAQVHVLVLVHVWMRVRAWVGGLAGWACVGAALALHKCQSLSGHNVGTATEDARGHLLHAALDSSLDTGPSVWPSRLKCMHLLYEARTSS